MLKENFLNRMEPQNGNVENLSNKINNDFSNNTNPNDNTALGRNYQNTEESSCLNLDFLKNYRFFKENRLLKLIIIFFLLLSVLIVCLITYMNILERKVADYRQRNFVKPIRYSFPLLANGRNLYLDVSSLLQPDCIRSEKRKDLLDTTYDNIADNLLLDLNMIFEEILQFDIFTNPELLLYMKNVFKLLQKNLPVDFLRTIDTKNLKTAKENSIKFILKFIFENNLDYFNKKLKINSENGLYKQIYATKTLSLQDVTKGLTDEKSIIYMETLKNIQEQYLTYSSAYAFQEGID